MSVSAADAAIEGLNAAAVGLDDFPNAADLVELDLQLVDLAQDFVEAGYLGVGVGYDIAGAVVLHLGGCLGLLGEMGPALLDAVQQTVKVRAQCLQTGRVEQQTALRRGLAGGARG